MPQACRVVPSRRRILAGMAFVLLLGGCSGGDASDDPPASEGGDLQRSVVVDRPAGSPAAGTAANASGTAKGSDGAKPSAAASPSGTRAAAPARPSVDPLADAAVFATATADAAAALAAVGGGNGGGLISPTVISPAMARQTPPAPAAGASPADAGRVLALSPLPCAALTLDSAEAPRDCAAELLQSGRLEGRELIALVGFDLSALPAGAELLYAGLELVTADTSFARSDSSWRVEAVDLPSPSFSQVLAALPLAPSLIWRVSAADLAPGRRLTVELGEEARAYLMTSLAAGRVRLAFRIQVAGRSGGLAGWQARGERGPRLRLAYLDPATAEASGVTSGAASDGVDWQAPPAAPAPGGRP